MTALRLVLSIVVCLAIGIGAAILLLLISPGLLDDVPTSWALLALYCIAIFVLNIAAGWAIGVLRPMVGRVSKIAYLVVAILFALVAPVIGAISVALYECIQGYCS